MPGAERRQVLGARRGWGTVLGAGISSLSARLMNLGVTALMLSGAGLAGYSYFEVQQQIPGVDPTLIQRNAPLLIGLGVAGMVVGGIARFVGARRMAKQMRAQMGSMGAMGGMGFPAMPGMPGGMPGFPAPKEVVKVRCRACSALQAEDAEFCSKCGKPLGASAPPETS